MSNSKLKSNHKRKKNSNRVLSSSPAIVAFEQRVQELEQYVEQLSTQHEDIAQQLQQLEESRDRYAQLYTLAPVGYVTFDRYGRIMDINETGLRMVGFDSKAIASRLFFTNFVVQSDLPLFSAHLLQCRNSGKPQAAELHLKFRPKGQFLGHLVTCPMWDPETGNQVYWTVISDISQREEMEQEHDRLSEELRKSRDRLAQLSHALLQIQEDQRRSIARELHDEVSQNLTALGLSLKLVESHIPANAGDRWQAPLRDAQKLVVETTQRVRQVTTNLRPTALDYYGLGAALEGLVKSFQDRTQLDIELKTDSRLPRLESNIEIALYRIAQEALTNVTKHAHASHITIKLEAPAHKVRLIIADNGVGFDPENLEPKSDSQGLGLTTISERVLSLQGTIAIDSEPGKGTRITVEVPR